jgi:hypothetical protein
MRAAGEQAGITGPVITTAEAASVLGVSTLHAVQKALKRGGCKPVGVRPQPAGRKYKLYRKADVERVAASLATGELRDAAEEERFIAASLDAGTDAGTVRYGDEVIELPAVMYGLLTWQDVRVLERRRAKYPDWRPSEAA